MPPCSLAASIAAFRMPQTLRAAIHWAVPSLPLPKHSLPPCPAPGRPLMPQPCRLHPSQQTKPSQTKPSPGPGQPPVPHGTVKAHPLLQTGRHPQPHTFLHRRRGRGGTSSAARPRAPSPPARTQQACKRRQVIPSSSPAPSSTIRPAPDKRHSATPPVLHVPRDDGLQTLLSPPAGFGPTLPAGILAASPLQRWHASIFFFSSFPFTIQPQPHCLRSRLWCQRRELGSAQRGDAPQLSRAPLPSPALARGRGHGGLLLFPALLPKAKRGGKKRENAERGSGSGATAACGGPFLWHILIPLRSTPVPRGEARPHLSPCPHADPTPTSRRRRRRQPRAATLRGEHGSQTHLLPSIHLLREGGPGNWEGERGERLCANGWEALGSLPAAACGLYGLVLCGVPMPCPSCDQQQPAGQAKALRRSVPLQFSPFCPKFLGFAAFWSWSSAASEGCVPGQESKTALLSFVERHCH